MSSEADPKPNQQAPSLIYNWGTNPLPATVLSSLVVPQHTRPLRAPILFVGPLLFASYVQVAGFTTDGAAMSAAWSGMYALLAMRRKQTWKGKFSVRGAVRGTAVGLGLANLVCGGWVWATGNRKADEAERKSRNRWA